MTVAIPEFLYSYQKEDVQRMLEKLQGNRGVINASIMGSGKTLVALVCALNYATEPDNILIIAPKPVLQRWREECERLKIPYTINKEGGGVAIINYEKLLSSKFSWVLKRDWDIVIADEAHKLKNRRAKRSKVFEKLITQKRVFLTGTPIVNKPDDFFNLLRLSKPQQFRHFEWDYLLKYFEVKEQRIYTRTGRQIAIYKVVGISNRNQLLKDIEPIYLRRERAEVLKDLPPVVREQRYVTLSPVEKKYYTAVAEGILQELEGKEVKLQNKLVELLRLRQAAISPRLVSPEAPDVSSKIDDLVDVISDCDGQVVVFTTFIEAAEMAKRKLCEAEIDARTLTGNMNDTSRLETIRGFQRGDFRVLCATTAIAREGLDFQNAGTVVFLDRDWSVGNNEQAEGRLIRIGQKNDFVVVVDIIAPETLDVVIHNMLETKQYYIDNIVVDSKTLKKILFGKLDIGEMGAKM